MRIELTDFRVGYGSTTAVQVTSFTARAGEVVALVGPNGSGKSSLLKGIAALAGWTGKRRVNGRVSFMPQDTGSTGALTLIETVMLGRLGRLGLSVPAAEVERAAASLVAVGLSDLSSRLLSELSGGQRQLVFLAQALAGEPDILLLDEPTSALDIRNALGLLGRLRAEARDGRCVVVAIHDLNAALRFCDRAVVLHEGRIIADGPPASALTSEILSAVYGVSATLIHDGVGRSAIAFEPRARGENG